jgi:hypothetical protein
VFGLRVKVDEIVLSMEFKIDLFMVSVWLDGYDLFSVWLNGWEWIWWEQLTNYIYYLKIITTKYTLINMHYH